MTSFIFFCSAILIVVLVAVGWTFAILFCIVFWFPSGGINFGKTKLLQSGPVLHEAGKSEPLSEHRLWQVLCEGREVLFWQEEFLFHISRESVETAVRSWGFYHGSPTVVVLCSLELSSQHSRSSVCFLARAETKKMKLLENVRLDTISAAISTDTGDSRIEGRWVRIYCAGSEVWLFNFRRNFLQCLFTDIWPPFEKRYIHPFTLQYKSFIRCYAL